jgi:hypothetical protein
LSGMSGFPGYSGPGPETPGCKGINTFDRGEKDSLYPFTVQLCPISLPSPPSPPHLSPWRFPPSTGQI